MDNSKNVPLMISLPKKYRDLLRRMAAEKNLAMPDDVVSAARLGKEIICEYLENSKKKEETQSAKDMAEEVDKVAQCVDPKINNEKGV
jgi:hypothetical protein